jgi:hypothetical protein
VGPFQSSKTKAAKAAFSLPSSGFHDTDTKRMPKENNKTTFEGRDLPTLFREFAAECIELAQTNSSPEKRALYMKMACVWHQMAQRWEKKG